MKRKMPTQPYVNRKNFNERIKIKTGTFLHTYCPHCSASLITDNMIHLIAVNEDGNEFDLDLSPYLDVYERRSKMDIQPQSVLKDLKCSACGKSIVDPDIKCGACGKRTALLSVAAVHLKVPFYICLKEGCHWHGITPEDEQIIIQDVSDEW